MNYDNVIYSSLIADLPAQMIPLSKKDDKWKEQIMDALEQVGRTQHQDNLRLIENYEMVKGKFIFSHYFETDGYNDYIAQLTREFKLPSYLRHYDIISQVINTLIGEYQKRPDTFRVKDFSEAASNEYERAQTDLLHKYINSKIEAEVAKKLLEQGIDPENQNFNSPEEQQQYQQMIEQAKQQLTPPEIKEYMETKWTQAGEIWGQHQIEYDKQKFNLAEKESKEFQDMLVADRCFRHFYLTPTGFSQETWNPIHVFFHKSPTIEEVENGDYVGRVFPLSMPAIIDRYGHLLTEDQLKDLEEVEPKTDKRWNFAAGTEYVYDEYMMPFKGYPAYELGRATGQLEGQAGIPTLEPGFFSGLYEGKFFNERKGLYYVTEAYWMSQMRLGKVIFIDPETGIKTTTFVDENFIVPEEFTQYESSFYDSDDVNTVTWTWVNQLWQGKKIRLTSRPDGKDLYFDIRPADFQGKGDFNPYGAKLPVIGQIFSIRNSKSMSLVDLMKPYQIFYNVAMNQLYQLMEKEIGHFMVFDPNMFPDQKDWGGENAYKKFMLVAKNYGLVPADTSPQNLKGALAAAGGYLPKEFNFDDSARMMSRLQLAQQFEQMGLRQVGFNQYRLGAYGAEATAAGVAAGQQTSYAQTESYFTNFSNYLRRCYETDLSMAQFVQAKDRDATILLNKSDQSRAFIKIAGVDLLLAELGVRVVNSQEYIRQIETLRQLAINNNTSGASMADLAEVITANSPEQIKIRLKESQKRQEEMQQQEYDLKQQQLQQQQQIEQAKLEQAERHFQEGLQNNLDVVYAKEGTKVITSVDDKQITPSDQALPADNSERNDIDRQRLMADSEYKNKKLALEQQKIQAQLQLEHEKLNVVKTMKGKKQ